MKRLLLSLLLSAGCFILPQAGSAAPAFDFAKFTNGAESAPSQADKFPEESEVVALRDAARAEHRRAEENLAALGPETAESGGPYEQRRLALLEKLSATYDELLGSIEALRRVETRLHDTETSLQGWKSDGPPKNFTADFAALDKLQSQIIESQKTHRSRKDLFKARQSAVEQAQTAFEEAEGARRLAKERSESAATPKETIEKERVLALARLDSQVAQATLQLRQAELQVSKRYRELSDKQRGLAVLQIAYLERSVAFDQASLDRELQALRSEQSGLEAALSKAESALPAIQRDYAKARRILEESGLPSPSRIEEAETKRLEQSLLEQQISALTERLKRLKEKERLWNQRFEVLSGKADNSQIRVWQEQTRQSLEEIKREEDLLSLRINSVRDNLAEARQKRAADTDPSVQTWRNRQLGLIQESLDLMQDNQALLISARKLNESFLYEQEQRLSQVTWTERLHRLWENFLSVWNFEVTSVDDAPITVGKILVALVLVFFGGLLARRLSHWLATGILPRFGVNAGVSAALRTLSFYLLFLFFFILALNVVKVPLTLFAVVGGAVAIGVGFGSQNLMNNFISGLILLIERPIKVGDVVQMEGVIGVVERIGGRSTLIRTADNTHFIVPNSSFLEKAVANWTLADDMLRCNIRVGVAYGSSPRQVADILRKAADGHGKLLKSPKPMVTFSDFGNDALVFDLFYWVKLRSIGERREVESDLRFMIAGAFEEAGITVPFPQRDVHLHSSSPLELKISRDFPKKELQE